jgi:hypothetical protein
MNSMRSVRTRFSVSSTLKDHRAFTRTQYVMYPHRAVGSGGQPFRHVFVRFGPVRPCGDPDQRAGLVKSLA